MTAGRTGAKPSRRAAARRPLRWAVLRWVAAAALPCAGCAAPGPPGVIRAAFACAGGGGLDVAFDAAAGTAEVRGPGASGGGAGTHLLPIAASGSGYAYEGDGYRLRGTGREAVWTVPGAAPLRCRER